MTPQRIQLSRAKGFNLQAASRLRNGLDAAHVARPGPWGNPFVVGKDGSRAECVRLFKLMCGGLIAVSTNATPDEQMKYLRHAAANRESLRGKNLACWCSADAECHATILLSLANTPKVEQ